MLGLTYSVLQSIYEYFIVLKTREQARGLLGDAGDNSLKRS